LWAPPGCRARLLEVLERAGVGDRVTVMPPEGASEEPDASIEAGTGVEGEHVGEPPGDAAPEEISDGAEAAEGAEPGAPGGDLYQILEAQAKHLLALGQATASLLQAQKTQQEKLDKLLELQEHQTKLLEKMITLLEQLAQAKQHGETTEPKEPPPRETETPAKTPEETGEPKQPDEQTCTPVKLDHPQGETACLPPETAQKALQLRRQGYKLLRTRTGKLYATRGTRKLALE